MTHKLSIVLALLVLCGCGSEKNPYASNGSYGQLDNDKEFGVIVSERERESANVAGHGQCSRRRRRHGSGCRRKRSGKRRGIPERHIQSPGESVQLWRPQSIHSGYAKRRDHTICDTERQRPTHYDRSAAAGRGIHTLSRPEGNDTIQQRLYACISGRCGKPVPLIKCRIRITHDSGIRQDYPFTRRLHHGPPVKQIGLAQCGNAGVPKRCLIFQHRPTVIASFG